MGVTPYFQAIPEDCDLFRWLQKDRRLGLVMNQFFWQGSRPLDIDELEPDEAGEILDWLHRNEGDVFKSRGR